MSSKAAFGGVVLETVFVRGGAGLGLVGCAATLCAIVVMLRGVSVVYYLNWVNVGLNEEVSLDIESV